MLRVSLPDLGLDGLLQGRLHCGGMAVVLLMIMLRGFALAVSAEHLDLLLGRQLLLDRRLDDVDLEGGQVEEVVVGDVRRGVVFDLREAGAIGGGRPVRGAGRGGGGG